MFKIDFENEIYNDMKKKLISNKTEVTHNFDKLAKAIDYLNNAAVIFEKAGMFKEAEEITKLLKQSSFSIK
jgi:hypothetical protein